MPANAYQRVLAIAGILFAVLIAVALVLTGSEPSETDPAAKVFNYWSDHKTAEIIAALAAHAAAVLFVFFGAGVRSALRSGEAGEATYSVVAFGGAVLAATGFAIAGMVSLAATTAADQGAANAVYTLNQLSAIDWIPFTAGLTVMLLAAGLGGLRTLALPRWLSWAAIALGVMFLTPVGAFGFSLIPLWVLAVSIVLYRRPSEASGPTATVPNPAT